jgi:hypothetical protein
MRWIWCGESAWAIGGDRVLGWMHRYYEARDGLRSSVMAKPSKELWKRGSRNSTLITCPHRGPPVNNASLSLILGLNAHTRRIKTCRRGMHPTCATLSRLRSKYRGICCKHIASEVYAFEHTRLCLHASDFTTTAPQPVALTHDAF